MSELDRSIAPHKRDLISQAFSMHKITSFVDIGACWGVNGGYAFHALSFPGVERAFILDGKITRLTRERASRFPQLELHEGNIGDPHLIEKIGLVDAAICFDILLHQVAPDWDEFLRAYASRVKIFIIYNQNYVGSRESIRFIDQGVEGYLQHTPYRESGREGEIKEWFRKHDVMCPALNRKWRDVYYYWQWGITQADLIRVLWDAGFQVDFLKNYGFWGVSSTIQNQGLICSKVRD